MIPAVDENAKRSFGFRHSLAKGAKFCAELASVGDPGAHGMISGMSEQMLEMFGFFKKLSDGS